MIRTWLMPRRVLTGPEQAERLVDMPTDPDKVLPELQWQTWTDAPTSGTVARLDDAGLMALGERRAELEAQLTGARTSVELAAAMAKLDADYATERKRLQREAAGRNRPRSEPPAKAAPTPRLSDPFPTHAGSPWVELLSSVLAYAIAAALVIVALCFVLGPEATAHILRTMATGAGVMFGEMPHFAEAVKEGAR